MKIRLLTPREHHIEQLGLLSQAFAAEHPWAGKIPIGQLADYDRAKAKLFGQDVAAVQVAEHPEGQLIGYCAVYQYQAGIYEASILIDPRYRKTGVARQLVDAVFARLPKGIIVEAWVLAQNQEGLEAFPRLGFRLKEIIDNVILDQVTHQVYLFHRTT